MSCNSKIAIHPFTDLLDWQIYIFIGIYRGRSASRSATSSANMSSKSRIAIQIHWQIYRGWGRSASRSATSSANISCNSEIAIQIHCQIYMGRGRSALHLPIWAQRVKLPIRFFRSARSWGRSASRPATSSANMRCNSKIAIQIHWQIYRGVDLPDLPLHLPIWAQRVKLPFRSIGMIYMGVGSASRSATSSASI